MDKNMAEPLDGACAVIPCRNTSVILAHTNVGLGGENDGEQVDAGGFSVIRINPALSGGEYLDTVLHEFTHAFFPDLTEETVKQFASQACGLLCVPEVKQRTGAIEIERDGKPTPRPPKRK